MSDHFEPRHELRSPLDLTNDMDYALFWIKKGTNTLNDLRRALLEAKDEYTRAFEERKLDLKSKDPKMSLADRESQARLDNWASYLHMNIAQAEFDYARDKMNNLDKQLSKSQSEAKLVIKEMEMSR